MGGAITSKQSVFKTRWFDLVAKTVEPAAPPHYALETLDFVSTLAVTESGDYVLVRQFRPAVENVTLELPSGHREPEQTPEEAARTELLEETGFVADRLVSVGMIHPDTGRMGNRMWCFFAPAVLRSSSGSFVPETGVEPVLYSKSLRTLINSEPAFSCSLHHAVILRALACGYAKL